MIFVLSKKLLDPEGRSQGVRERTWCSTSGRYPEQSSVLNTFLGSFIKTKSKGREQ